MPKKIQECSKAHLISVPLPQHGASYTVISHQFVIDYSYQALANAGFVIVDEEYRCTADGQIAQGIFKLQYNNDPDLSMMFAWTNSYNKQVKFKCLIGAYINQTGTVMTSGDIGTWARKHVGTADVETKATIDNQIANAYMYYNQLVADKASMVGITLNKRKQAQLLGVLFAEFQILTTEQASIIRSQMDRPSHVYEDSNSLWAFYNYVTIALQHSHPRTWMEDQRILHYFIGTVCKFSTPVQPVSTPVNPLITNYGEPENQTNLLVQIAETTGDESVLELSLPVEPADYDFTQTVDYSKAIHPVTTDEAFKKMADDIKENNPDLYNGLSHLAKAEADMLVHGDDTLLNKISEVTKQALENDLIFGISGIDVSPDEIRNVPINELLEEMREENPIPKVTENEDSFVSDEIITYTDLADNTFEAPVISPCVGHDAETEKDLEEEIRETEVANFFKEVTLVPSLEPTPEEYVMSEAEENQRLANESLEADLDLKQNVTEIKQDDELDLDLDFESDDFEEELGDTPDFF